MPHETEEEFRARNPHLAKFFPYMELLNKESDRGAVLISTGFLEQQLRDILLAFMQEKPQSIDLLDGGNAPLGTFSSRIAACYALGLIAEREYHDLTLMRRIRNDFAHDIHTSFETPSVIDRCKQLHGKAPDYDSEKLGEVRVNPSGQFRSAALTVILNLTNRAHYVARQRRPAASWPI
jgi:mannitol operon repressor